MAKIFNCPLCTKFYDNRRSLNAHMLKAHYDDYKEHGFSIDSYDDVTADAAREEDSRKHSDNFRPLDLSVENEAIAYKEGYRFIDDADICYTIDEAKDKGWI